MDSKKTYDILPSPLQVVVELPTVLPANAASAYCNHGFIMQKRAGVGFALLEESSSLFQRLDINMP